MFDSEPLHKNYTFEVRKVDGDRSGLEIVLTGNLNGKSKTFWLAGDKDTKAIIEHMKTLTDEQCDSFVGIKFKGKK